jgi:hypothetical protein
MSDADEALLKDRDILRNQIQDGIAGVRRAARRYRRESTLLLLTAMICGALATALAGDAFRGGTLAASAATATTGTVPNELPRGWRNVCGIIALLTLAGTLATGANSVLKIAEHRALDKANNELATLHREYAEDFP